jgi:hypothetical protein
MSSRSVQWCFSVWAIHTKENQASLIISNSYHIINSFV